MKNNKIPLCANVKELNPSIMLSDSPFFIPVDTQEWTAKKKYAAINSFGVGGANCFMILQDAPIIKSTEEENSKREVILLSAKEKSSLKEYVKKMIDFIISEEKIERASLKEIAYMTQIGREGMDHRIAFIATDKAELFSLLSRYYEGELGNEKDIFQGHRKNRDNHFLVVGDDGEAVVEFLIRSKNLEKLARLWVDGIDINWDVLHEEQKPLKKSIPVYPFDKMLCVNEHIQNSLNYDGVQKVENVAINVEEKKIEAVQVKTVKKDHLKSLTAELLKDIVSRATKIPFTKIEEDEVFESFGIDSVMFMNLIRMLENYYGDLSKALLLDYSTISQLSDYFIKEHYDLTVKNVEEMVRNKARV